MIPEGDNMCEDYDYTETEASMWKSIEDAIKTRIKEEQAEVIEELEYYKKQTKKLAERIRELEIQIPNQDNLHKKCIEEVRKEIFGQFKPGQTIYVEGRKGKYVKCITCAGTGKAKQILATGEKEIKCPSCYGSKQQMEYTNIPVKDYVGSIRLTLMKDDKSKITTDTKIYIRSMDRYMKLSEVFATEEECLEAIEQKNEEDANKKK